MKNKYLNDKLELERERLVKKGISADNITSNSAIQPEEYTIN